jgi:hypothetical protein
MTELQTVAALNTIPPATPRVTAGEVAGLLAAMEPRESKLATALTAARERCQPAIKDRRNQFQKYDYASSESIISEAREALKSTGLSPVLTSPKLRVTGSGHMAIYELTRHCHLIHTSGESVYLGELEWPVVVDKGRPIDKAFAIAITTSLAYFLRDLLLMPRGAQDDMDARKEDESTPSPPAAAAGQPPPAMSTEKSSGTESEMREREGLISVEQYDELTKLIAESGTDHQKFCEHYQINGVSMLPAQHFNDARGKLLAKLKPTPEQCDRIDSLCMAMKLDNIAAEKKLREFLPDVRSFTELNRLQAGLVIEAMAKSAAVQGVR